MLHSSSKGERQHYSNMALFRGHHIHVLCKIPINMSFELRLRKSFKVIYNTNGKTPMSQETSGNRPLGKEN